MGDFLQFRDFPSRSPGNVGQSHPPPPSIALFGHRNATINANPTMLAAHSRLALPHHLSFREVRFPGPAHYDL